MWKVTRCLDLLSESPHGLGPARDDPYVTQCRWIAGPSFLSLCGAADRLLALVFRSVGDVVSPLWLGVLLVAATSRRARHKERGLIPPLPSPSVVVRAAIGAAHDAAMHAPIVTVGVRAIVRAAVVGSAAIAGASETRGPG